MWIWTLFAYAIIQSCICFEDPSQSSLISPRDGKGWDSNKSTFFDVSLTALAFLSFGVFLLNLLLNALIYPSYGTTQVTQPDPILTMITGGTTGGAIITGRSRQLFSPQIDRLTATTTLVDFVTNSIELLTKRHECLSLKICEGSRQASVIGKRYQLLFSLISFSISYLGQILGLHNDVGKHLNAMLLGARNENCQLAFPDCNHR